MNTRVPRIVIEGIFGGALVGFLIGAYVVVLTRGHVIQRADFVYPLAFEQAQSRYLFTMLFVFVAVFAAVGPVIAAASFGPWIRHAVYGLAGGVTLAVVVALLAASIMDQQPFNMYKGSKSTCIDIARVYAVPVAIIIGPITGILFGTLRRCRAESIHHKHGNET